MTPTEQIEYMYDEQNYPIFKIEVEQHDYKDVSFKARVYEITAWSADDKKEPLDPELYLSCYIKWDSCSHFYFGEEDEANNPSGYLHICGVEYYKQHIQLLEHLYKRAFEVMGREPLEGEELAKIRLEHIQGDKA